MINFNDALKKYNIDVDKQVDSENDKFKIINLKCYFEKNYYNQIMEVCHNDNITLEEILNEALGMYMSLNYIDEDEHQKKLKKLWENFNNNK